MATTTIEWNNFAEVGDPKQHGVYFVCFEYRSVLGVILMGDYNNPEKGWKFKEGVDGYRMIAWAECPFITLKDGKVSVLEKKKT